MEEAEFYELIDFYHYFGDVRVPKRYGESERIV